MPKIPMNAMKKEDIKKLGDKGNIPMPPPKRVKDKIMGYPKSRGSTGRHPSGWF